MFGVRLTSNAQTVEVTGVDRGKGSVAYTETGILPDVQRCENGSPVQSGLPEAGTLRYADGR